MQTNSANDMPRMQVIKKRMRMTYLTKYIPSAKLAKFANIMSLKKTHLTPLRQMFRFQLTNGYLPRHCGYLFLSISVKILI